MADQTSPHVAGQAVQSTPDQSSRPRGIPLHQLYALPAPIRTFPLPTFYPSNPLSLAHVLWAWVKEVVAPPPAEPSIVHQAFWSAETRSVHVRDPKSIRALWEQGFFGKGNYSRSEPNWLKAEQTRLGKLDRPVAELNTAARREERKLTKWARARKEQEAILRTQLEEAWVAPVGPIELLALPNSSRDIVLPSMTRVQDGLVTPDGSDIETSRNVQLDGLDTRDPLANATGTQQDGVPGGPTIPSSTLAEDTPPKTPASVSPPSSQSGSSTTPKRRKSVRFSPKVESQTFQFSDPPSPHLGALQNGKTPNEALTSATPSSPQSNGTAPPPQTSSSRTLDSPSPEKSEEVVVPDIVDREHLQLSLEEAFYLVYALGVLTITDPTTGQAIATQDLFDLFRQVSYYPRRTADLQPDDPFLVHYVVYHHFRSLGWVPRSGVKFGVDWLLYFGGPVFAHGEFAVQVIPSYSHPYWKSRENRSTQRSWHSLHSISRVQSHALKTLVLVYVDIPPPSEKSDPTSLIKQYKVREFVIRRFVANKHRK